MQEKILSVRVHKAVNSIEYACSSVSGSHSVEVLDLQSSVAGMSKSQWSKLCRLLTKRPLLTLLSLRKCSITNDQGTCNILQSGGVAVVREVSGDGQHQRVDIPVHARTAHKGPLLKRLEEDLC